MYLPSIYKKFSEKYPDIFNLYNDLGVACRNAGPLSEKDQNLVKLGIAIGSSSRGGASCRTPAKPSLRVLRRMRSSRWCCWV